MSSFVPNAPPALMLTSAHPPFTVAQWQELEYQAHIFSYIEAGVTVPQHLLVPIQKSLQLSMMSQSQRNYPYMGYYGNNGKKIDPEPGRCKRTDGKKWRCAKKAHPESKYCERHMMRRRLRSRKLVEPPLQSSQSQSSSSSAAAVTISAAAVTVSAAAAATTGTTTTTVSAAGTGNGTYQNLPLHTDGSRQGFTMGNGNNHNNNNTMSMMEPLPLLDEVAKKEFRFGLNSEVDEYNFLQKDMGSEGYQGFDDFTSSDDSWSLTFHLPKHIVSESRRRPTVDNNCFQQQTVRDAEMSNFYDARSKEPVFDGQLSTPGCLKEEYQFPQPLFSDSQLQMDSSSSSIDYRPIIDFDCNPDVN